MQVLIIKTSSMGDILHTLPSLTDAMEKIPEIRFDWVVEESFAQIPTWHKAVNLVIPVSIRRWRRSWFSPKIKEERNAFRKKLRAKRYDVVIDAQGLIKSAALVTRIAYGIKHGMNMKTVREPLASLFYDCCHHVMKKQHAVERNRELFAKSLGYLIKPYTPYDYAISAKFLYKRKKNNVPYVVFVHGTTRNNKHWPEKHWNNLIKLMKSSNLFIKLPWGNKYEYQRAKRLATGFSYVEVLPKLSLEKIAENLAGAEVVVSVDTGLSHLTVALKKLNIVLFGPTHPEFIGSYEKHQYQVISPTKKMEDITADKIFILLKDIIGY